MFYLLQIHDVLKNIIARHFGGNNSKVLRVPGVCLFGKDFTTSSNCSGAGLGRIGVGMEFEKDKQQIKWTKMGPFGKFKITRVVCCDIVTGDSQQVFVIFN